MEQEIFRAGDCTARVYRCNTAVVGSGAAGYNAAGKLWQLGQHDILLVTENRTAGTSRNTGSDKQTYYKLTLSGSEPDSVWEVARTLFEGRCVDGDTALCEAALSVPCFVRLAELGVPFPHNRYGEYIGYKTDHDPRRRATSAGPYTSRQMTECLEHAVCAAGVPLLDRMLVIKVLSEGGTVCGLLCLDRQAKSPADRFVLIRCKNVIFATGGPAGMYANSVYPASQYGATGLALEAGAHGQNLTEWQYGLASVSPRWNVSGTYMQVLPRVYSTAADGSDPREFLLDFFPDVHTALSMLFLKGYQWPFDVRKVRQGSSLIDLLVYQETCKGRTVYLDFRRNPADGCFHYEKLLPEAQEYLRRAGACFGTPIQRLAHMNQPAIDFFRDKGLDLYTQPLEIALCAQHNNGGLAVDCWWQTHVQGLFAAGEAAGTHGVYRPGGTALNAGQVGSTRAAQYIAAHGRGDAPPCFEHAASEALQQMAALAKACAAPQGTVRALWQQTADRMSRCAGAIRDPEQLQSCRTAAAGLLAQLPAAARWSTGGELALLYRLRDMLISQCAYLSAMIDYCAQGGKSRGSALYTDRANGEKPLPALPDTFAFSPDETEHPLIQELWYEDGTCRFAWRTPRPLPQEDDFFENVWRSYRENQNIV